MMAKSLCHLLLFALFQNSLAQVTLPKSQKLRGLKCPANQQFLPNVQYGCPASCDRPIPRCRAAIGPGCGCKDGMVLAASRIPSNPKHCIHMSKCNACSSMDCPPGQRCDPKANRGIGGCVDIPKCSFGKPASDPKTGKELFCGRGGVECPRGTKCKIHPTDQFAVCCKVQTPRPTRKPISKPPSKCPSGGNPIKDPRNGKEYTCGLGKECPFTAQCVVPPGAQVGFCCLTKTPRPTLRPTKKPIKKRPTSRPTKKPINTTRRPTSRPTKKPIKTSSICPFGDHIKDPITGKAVTCGSGRTCPFGAKCILIAASGSNTFRVCCSTNNPSPTSRPTKKPIKTFPRPTRKPIRNPPSICPLGNPVKDPITGKTATCGPGRTCPFGARCIPIAASGSNTFSVCCSTNNPRPTSRPTKKPIRKPIGITPPKCPFGNPLKKNGKELFCGKGGVGCPKGSKCIIDPADRFAVCCKDVGPRPTKKPIGKPLSICPSGDPINDPKTGQIFKCGPGRTCPFGGRCIPIAASGSNTLSVCCSPKNPKPIKKTPQPICPQGKPMLDKTGKTMFCGIGSSNIKCPFGSECIAGGSTKFGVCCTKSDSCSRILCRPGLQCDPDFNNGQGGCVPIKPTKCLATGCSKEVCAAEPVLSTCAVTCESQCTKLSKCVFQSGSCRWEANKKYAECLKSCSACSQIKCSPGRVCDPKSGACVPDKVLNRCPVLKCPPGKVCNPKADNGLGACVPAAIGGRCSFILCIPGTKCDPNADNGLGACVPIDHGDDNRCPTGNPLTNNFGKELFCGRGPGRVNCPSGSFCNIDPTDRFAVCCRTKKTPVNPCNGVKCPVGSICDPSRKGTCVPSNPCSSIICPHGTRCDPINKGRCVPFGPIH